MKSLVLKWVVLAASIVISAYLTGLVFPGGFVVTLGSVGEVAMVFAGTAAFAVLNATLGRIVRLLAIPLNCLTLGLFSLVINAAMLMVAGSLGLGIKVDGFLPALVGSVLVSAVGALLGAFVKDKDGKD